MDLAELQNIVDAILADRNYGKLRPHELLKVIHRKSFPAEALAILQPMLKKKGGYEYKYAIDIVGRLKGAGSEASDAIEAAWERTWQHGCPQATDQAFPALLRLGNNDERLLPMIRRAMKTDNYGIHKICAETLMKIRGGDAILAKWDKTIAGKCDCHLHRKLADKIKSHLAAA